MKESNAPKGPAEGRMSIAISSPPDRDKVVAEVFFGFEQWAEINQEADRLTLEIYPRPSAEQWVFPFDDALKALTDAKNHLIGE